MSAALAAEIDIPAVNMEAFTKFAMVHIAEQGGQVTEATVAEALHAYARITNLAAETMLNGGEKRDLLTKAIGHAVHDRVHADCKSGDHCPCRRTNPLRPTAEAVYR